MFHLLMDMLKALTMTRRENAFERRKTLLLIEYNINVALDLLIKVYLQSHQRFPSASPLSWLLLPLAGVIGAACPYREYSLIPLSADLASDGNRTVISNANNRPPAK